MPKFNKRRGAGRRFRKSRRSKRTRRNGGASKSFAKRVRKIIMDPRSKELKGVVGSVANFTCGNFGAVGTELMGQITIGPGQNEREGASIFLRSLKLDVNIRNTTGLPTNAGCRDMYVGMYMLKRFQADQRNLLAADLHPLGHMSELYKWPEAKPSNTKGIDVLWRKELKIPLRRLSTGTSVTDLDCNFNRFFKKNVRFNPPLRVSYMPGTPTVTYVDVLRNQIWPVFTGLYFKDENQTQQSGNIRFDLRVEWEFYE